MSERAVAQTRFADHWRRYWFEGAAVLKSRLVAFRFAFFALLAFDQWLLMLEHAPRYGVNDFNVADFGILEQLLPVPNAGYLGLLYLVGGCLSLLAALGVNVRSSVIGVTITYSLAFFWSHLDSYQHHYMVCLLLFLMCFIPWSQAQEAGADGSRRGRISSWAVRLIYIEVAIVYFFTAVAKVDDDWVSGWTMQQIVKVEWINEMFADAATSMSWEAATPYAIAGVLVMLGEFFLPIALVVPRLRKFACILGPMFHIGVEVLGLKIGWFSYYMIAMYYILVIPDSWFVVVSKPCFAVGRWIRERMHWAYGTEPLERWVGIVLALVVAGIAAFATTHVPVAGIGDTAAVIFAVVVLGLAVRKPSMSVVRDSVIYLVVVATMVFSVLNSEGLYNYHRYWGGDLARRGNLEEAVEHYVIANQYGEGRARFTKLGQIYERLGRYEEALRSYEEGLARDPDDARARQGIARVKPRVKSRTGP